MTTGIEEKCSICLQVYTVEEPKTFTPTGEAVHKQCGEIDPGVIEMVRAMSKLPGVETFSSCEGHFDDPDEDGFRTFAYGHVAFSYSAGLPIPWIERVLHSSITEDVCLGCLRVRMTLDHRFDCGHNFSGPLWSLEIVPRLDYGPGVKEHVQAAWDAMTKEIEAIVGEG